MAKTFDQYVKEYGSVSKALAATGHTQNSSGSWVSSGSSSSSKSSSNSGSTTTSKSSTQYSSNPITTDYQAKINQAVARGDFAEAARQEQLRNQKIQSSNYTGQQTVTNNYSQYLPSGSGSKATSDVGKTNHAANILSLIGSSPDGSAREAVAAALAERNQKITSNPTIYGKDINGIYVGDSITQQALDYINSTPQQFKPQLNVGNTMGQAITPNLVGSGIGDLYGITYDQNTIKDILNRATEAEYASKEAEYGTTENKYINQAQTDQATTLDTLRRSNQQASMNNAMMGANSANALSAILSGQQLNATNMLDLANQRNLLQSQKAAAMTANASTALSDSNAIKQAIANIDLSKYGYDTQQMVGQLDYLAALNDALAQIKSSQTAADATKYASDNDLAGTKYNADSYQKNTSGGGGGGAYTPNNKTGTGSGTGEGTQQTPNNTATGGSTPPSNTKYTVTSKIGADPVVAYKNSDGTYSVVTDKNGTRNSFTSDQYKIIEKEGSAQAVTDPSGWVKTSAKSIITAPSMDGRGSVAQRAVDNYKAITKATALSDKSTIICAGKVYKWQPSANAWYLANSDSTTPFTTVFVMQQLNKSLSDSNTKIEL